MIDPVPQTFRFISYRFDPAISTVYLRYAADEISFEETFVFPKPEKALTEERLSAIDHLLYYLHIAAGISYYKAFVPERISIESHPMSRRSARFFEDFYIQGLGEFSYKNKLDLRGKIKFPFSDAAASSPIPTKLRRRTAVPIGGGKDSVVTLEALKRMMEPVLGIAVGAHPTIQAISSAGKVPLIEIQRFLSPRLFEVNKRGALNGHVPIVGILSFVFLVAAVIYDFDTIAMSSERSADSGNLLYNGREINHQWSKSSEFEGKFQDLIESEIINGVRYFSFLRPLSEFQIAASFSRMTAYHPYFSSCNRGYKITQPNETKWCCDCDKCRFVFMALAPFLQKPDLVRIFGRDLLADPTAASKFKELLGLEGVKPFECVGEYEESQAALYLLMQRPEWKESPVVRILAASAEIKGIDLKAAYERAVAIKDTVNFPERFQKALHEITRSAG